MPYNELIKLKNAFSQLDVIDQNLKMRHRKAHLTLARIIIYASNMVRNSNLHYCNSKSLCINCWGYVIQLQYVHNYISFISKA